MIRITAFSEPHLEDALRLSQQVGWPHRRADWELVAALSNGVVARDGDRVVGTAFCTVFGDQAALNMIIVDAQMRGQGIGRKLMQAIIALAGGRRMALVATQDGLPLYEKLGFRAVGEVGQYQGPLARVPDPDDSVRCGGLADLDAMAAMDRDASGQDRCALLQRIAGSGSFFLSDQGFAMRRRFGRGKVVGPVIARDSAGAVALLTTALQGLGGAFLRVDTDPARGLVPLLEDLGLTYAGGGIAMRHGPDAGTPTDFTTYALASQALG